MATACFGDASRQDEHKLRLTPARNYGIAVKMMQVLSCSRGWDGICGYAPIYRDASLDAHCSRSYQFRSIPAKKTPLKNRSSVAVNSGPKSN
jgi:hypothetical protein